MFDRIVNFINNNLSYVLIVVLILGGLYFTLRTRFVQFRLLGKQIRSVTEKPKRKAGKNPVFKAKNIDLPHKTAYWN